MPKNTLFIPFECSLESLENAINQHIQNGQSLHINNIFEAGKFLPSKWLKSSIKINITKQNDIQLFAQKEEIYIKIPLQARLALTYAFQVNPIETVAEMNSIAKIQLYIKENWQLGIKAIIVGHEWLRRPAFKVMGFAVSQMNLLENDIAKALSSWTNDIELVVQKTIDLPEIISNIWQYLKNPIHLSPKKNFPIFLHLNPSKVGVSDFFLKEQSLCFNLKIGIELNILDKKIHNEISFLPKFNLLTDFSQVISNPKQIIDIKTTFSYTRLSAILSQTIQNFSLKSKLYEITFKNIQLYPKNNHLVIELNTAGTLNGILLLKTFLTYNSDKNYIYLSDFDFEMESSNKFANLANRFLHRSIAKTIHQRIEAELNKVWQNLPMTLNNYLYCKKLNRYIQLSGAVQSNKLVDLAIEKNHISISGQLNGQTSVILSLLAKK